MLVHPFPFCMSDAYFPSSRARLSYWNQSLIAPDIGFPRVCSVFMTLNCGQPGDYYQTVLS